MCMYSECRADFEEGRSATKKPTVNGNKISKENGIEALELMLACPSQSENILKSYSRPRCTPHLLRECSDVLNVTCKETPEAKPHGTSRLFQKDNAEFYEFLEKMKCNFKQKEGNDLEKIEYLKSLGRVSSHSRINSGLPLLKNA